MSAVHDPDKLEREAKRRLAVQAADEAIVKLRNVPPANGDSNYDAERELFSEASRRVTQTRDLLLEIIRIEDAALEISEKTRPPIPDFSKSDNFDEALREYYRSDAHKAWQEDASGEIRSALKQKINLEQELERSTESAYQIAFRAREALRSDRRFKKFECKGVRDVRNLLIQHPEKSNSGVLMHSFGYGAPCGPVIKALRLEFQKDVAPDSGLYVNLFEFFIEIGSACDRVDSRH